MMTAESIPTLAQNPIHVVVEKTALLKALSHCQGVVERRNTVAILAHILLEGQGDTLKITATDLEIAFIETVPAHIKAEGSTTVSAHLLFDIVRKLPEGAQIELKSSEDGASLHLQSGRSSYNFACLPPIDFPAITTNELPCTFKIHAGELSRLIDKTRFSMSFEETRYYLNGICFHATPDGFLRAIATDGLRLAQAQGELPPEASKMPQVIISRKTIHEIRKLIDELAEEVTISLSENQIRFVVASSILISRLIEGKFPTYENVIPYGNDKVLEVNAKAFAEIVDRISIMSTDKLRPIKIRVEGTTMVISAHSNETGNAEEQLEVKYEGEPIDFGFNARYILDVTQQISNESLQFLIGDETQAIIAKDANDSSALYVLMPMRV
ncbi:MAG TPA: DNA polymerase III subunit beta [Alphaproteobacteria bacterium]|nr:DNA polymerase III subunit beta [Alphaproteobacteria bacterium]